MDRRSTSAEYTHFGGDVTAQVNSSHGVRLSGGSTGGIVEAVGDDTNVSLVLRAQGTGPIRVGTSSNTVHFNSNIASSGTFAYTGSSFSVAPVSTGGITFGTSSNPVAIAGSTVAITSTRVDIVSTKVFIGAAGSTSFLMGIRKVFVEFTVPVMAANAGAEIGDIAVSGLTTNAVVTLAQRGPYNSSVAGLKADAYCSTAGQLHIELQNAGTTLGGSTMSAYAMIHEFGIPVP